MNNNFLFDEDAYSDIDLTPLIDVVFLLIIFFVLAASFSKPVLEIILPSSNTAEREQHDNGELLVEITNEGEIFYNNTLYNQDNIMQLLNADPTSTMVLHVDKEAPFKAFLLIIDSAKKINRNNIVVATDEEQLD